MWRRYLRPAIGIFVVLTVICGVIYPLVVTGVAQVVFSHQANGSLITDGHGTVVGSTLIGQWFDQPQYFWPRPSATTPTPYTAYNGRSGTSATGSNLGPTNPTLQQQVQAQIARLRAADPGNTAPIPVDLVTASASGLDPDISLAAAYFQVPRVARARGMTEGAVLRFVHGAAEGRQLGVLGEPRVNVLVLNRMLDHAVIPNVPGDPATQAAAENAQRAHALVHAE